MVCSIPYLLPLLLSYHKSPGTRRRSVSPNRPRKRSPIKIHQDLKKNKDASLLRFTNITFSYIKEPGMMTHHSYKTYPRSHAHIYCDISVSRPLYHQIVSAGLALYWTIDVNNKLRKHVLYRHNNQIMHDFDFANEFNQVQFAYEYKINLHLLYTQPRFKYHNCLTISDPDGYSAKVYIHFTIFLVDPLINHLQINLCTHSKMTSTVLPKSFKNPARQLNLIIPIRTRTHFALMAWKTVVVCDGWFYFSFISTTKNPIHDPLDVNFLSTAIFKDGSTWSDWKKDAKEVECKTEYFDMGDDNHQFTFRILLKGWNNFPSHDQIGWGLSIGRFKNPAFSMQFEFIDANYIQNVQPEHVYDQFLRDWLVRSNDWFNVDRNKFVQHDLDSLFVDRRHNFRPSKIMKYLSNMETKKKNKYDILNDLQFPFHYEFLKFTNEAGIDHGALSQEFFQTIFKALAAKLTKQFEAKVAKVLIRVWMMCLKMKGRYDDFDLQCRIPESYFNTLYMEIVFGKLDDLLRVDNVEDIVFYLIKLSEEGVINQWVPQFVNRYLRTKNDLDEIEIMMEALEITTKPLDKKQKLEFIKNYIYKIELSDFVDHAREDLVNLGLILSPKLVIGTNALSSSGMKWLSYEQFRALLYLQCESLLEEENVNKLTSFINSTLIWRGPSNIVGVMKKYFIQTVEKSVQNQDVQWLQDLLCFWTSKTHCIPESGLIHVITRYKGKPRVTASACFNEMDFPSYMAMGIQIFEDILDESIKSIKHGFTTS